MKPVIEVHGVSKAFSLPNVRRNTVREHAFAGFRPRAHHRHVVLDDVSFELQPGEALGLMGSNGCGKSTLLKIVSGIFVADAGHVVRRAPITPILELGVGWNGELDAIDNIYLIGSLMGLSLPELRAHLDAILDFAELQEFANLKVKHFSSGMAARLAYAVAFQAVREVLILDEIFAVGDAGFRRRCEERYRQLQAAGHAIVLVSHEPRAISTFCDRAVLLEHGHITMSGSPKEVADVYVKHTSLPQALDTSSLKRVG